jgi:hypothetical protein
VDLLQFLLVLAVLAVAVLVISAPLRHGGSDPSGSGSEDLTPSGQTPAALEAAKEAKYREIRDAELDRRTGKLSDEDWRALDAQLRAEAIEILRRLDQARGT